MKHVLACLAGVERGQGKIEGDGWRRRDRTDQTTIIIIIIIINIYIAPILFSAKRFTMLQKGLDKK